MGKLTPLMTEFMSEAYKGHFGISKNKPFSEEVLAEAKELGCYIPDTKTISWGEFRQISSFADKLYHITNRVLPKK